MVTRGKRPGGRPSGEYAITTPARAEPPELVRMGNVATEWWRSGGRARLGRRLEADAAADGGDHQVQWPMLRVTVLVDEVLRRLVVAADLDKLLLRVGWVVFAEVETEAALSLLNFDHGFLLGPCAPRRVIPALLRAWLLSQQSRCHDPSPAWSMAPAVPCTTFGTVQLGPCSHHQSQQGDAGACLINEGFRDTRQPTWHFSISCSLTKSD
jgi:hypothetical protein